MERSTKQPMKLARMQAQTPSMQGVLNQILKVLCM